MIETETFRRVKQVIADVCCMDKAEITKDSKFHDLCSDSLEFAGLIVEFEIEFGIDIGEPEKFVTVADAVKQCESLIEAT